MEGPGRRDIRGRRKAVRGVRYQPFIMKQTKQLSTVSIEAEERREPVRDAAKKSGLLRDPEESRGGS